LQNLDDIYVLLSLKFTATLTASFDRSAVRNIFAALTLLRARERNEAG